VNNDIETRPHTLYRFYAGDTLLYVGITANVGARWFQHSTSKKWWAEVTHTSVTHYPGRTEALDSEREAIINEKPLYNVQHNMARIPRGVVEKRSNDHERKSSDANSIILAGDIVAVGVHGGKCLVGVVKSTDRLGVRLVGIDLATGLSDHRPAVVLWSRMKEIFHACNTDPDELKALAKFKMSWEGYSGELDHPEIGEIQKFITDECIESPRLKSWATKLYIAYADWCSRNDVNAMTTTQFGRRLGALKFRKNHTRTGAVYLGLDLRPEGVSA
jgi:predicted GIY-YIG superfamily endonuclease